MSKTLVLWGRRRQVSQVARWDQFESNGGKGGKREKVMLKK